MIAFPLFIARRMSRGHRHLQGEPSTSPLLRLSTVGVALSLGVMLISVAIILGFKRQVSSFAYGQTGHISLYAWGGDWLGTSQHFRLGQGLRSFFEQRPDVRQVYPLLQKTALLKTEDNYEGLMIYGVDSAFSHPYFSGRMTSGAWPTFSTLDTVSNPIVLPSRLTERMKCNVGDKLRLYFWGDQIRVRAYQLVGIYESSGLDKLPAITSGSSLRRLDKLDKDEYSRLMIMLNDSKQAGDAMASLTEELGRNASLLQGQALGVNSAEELMPDLFNWLSLLDSNVYLLLSLMILVGGFTMITGLIIIVLDKTRQIGLLKALGANNRQIRVVFTLMSLRLMLRSLLWGNLLAGTFCALQAIFAPIKLDPRNYFMDAVPIVFEPDLWLGVNVGTALLILLMLLVPTKIISSISPASVMRFD
ncbi:MAG: ABC transporter permease [Porphyromonadaceae bacterium]|nr:ABC transporter permease [Porphyromonadaceae bacterium]